MSHPLREYRRVQLEVRKEFDAFTRVHCATCPAPCCVRPARITPTDILLAEAHGWRPRVASLETLDPVQQAARGQSAALAGELETLPREPCEHLGSRGCTVPADLRPFGCTTYICPIMYARMDRKALARLKRKVKALTQAHDQLMAALDRAGGSEEVN
jgi:hypothetical protein